MLGLLISLALSALVVVTSVAAMRRGSLEVGERVIARGQALFWVLTLGGVLGGTAIMMVSTRTFLQAQAEEDALPKALERDGVRVVFPATWEPLVELEKSMGSAATDVLAVGGDGAELLVLWPPAKAAPDAGGGTDGLLAMAAEMKNPAFSYARWDVRESAGTVIVEAEYPSPRGLVLSRHLIFVDAQGALRTVVATCSTEANMDDCRAVVSSLERTGVAETFASAEAPEAAPAGPRVLGIAIGGDHVCELDRSGAISCASGGGDPTEVAKLPGATRIAAAGDRTCVLGASGDITCAEGERWQERRDTGLTQMKSVAMGGAGVCGVTDVGRARCTDDAPPVPSNLTNVHGLAVGARHLCALTKRGEIVCWGSNARGQLGPDASRSEHRFSIRGAISIAAAGDFTCALLANRQPWCWGSGFGAPAEPLRIEGVDGATAMVGGENTICARLDSGSVRCWSTTSSRDIQGVSGATAVAVGRDRVCALVPSSSRVRCASLRTDATPSK